MQTDQNIAGLRIMQPKDSDPHVIRTALNAVITEDNKGKNVADIPNADLVQALGRTVWLRSHFDENQNEAMARVYLILQLDIEIEITRRLEGY